MALLLTSTIAYNSTITPTITCVEKINLKGKCVVWWGYEQHTKDKLCHRNRVRSYFSRKMYVVGKRPPKYFFNGSNKYVFKTVVSCRKLLKQKEQIYWKIKDTKVSINDHVNKNGGKLLKKCFDIKSCKHTKCFLEHGKYKRKVWVKPFKPSVKRKKCLLKCEIEKLNKKCLNRCVEKDKCKAFCWKQQSENNLNGHSVDRKKKLKLCLRKCYKKSKCCKRCYRNRVNINCYKKCNHIRKIRCKSIDKTSLVITGGEHENKDDHHRHKHKSNDFVPLQIKKITKQNVRHLLRDLKREYFTKLKNHVWVVPLTEKYTDKRYYMINFDLPHDGSGGSVKVKFNFPSDYNSTSGPRVMDYLIEHSQNKTKKRICKSKWKSENKVLVVKCKWNENSSGSLILNVSKGNCVKFHLIGSSGLDELKYALLSLMKSKSKRRWRRKVKYFKFDKNILCVKCNLKLKCRPKHWGIKSCKRYDRCGICNGNGSTCNTVKDKCAGCKLSVKLKNTCKVKLNPYGNNKEILIKVSGLYIKNVTTVKVNLKGGCVNANDWTSEDRLYKPNLKIYERVFKLKTTYDTIKNCLVKGHGLVHVNEVYVNPSLNVHHNHNGPLKRKLTRVKFPCRFHIYTKGTAMASSNFMIKLNKCKIKLASIKWIDPRFPRYAILKFWTKIKRHYGTSVKLTNPKVLGNNKNWVFVKQKEHCLNNGKTSKYYCKQLWVMRSKRVKPGHCLNGEILISFLKKNQLSGRKKKRIKVTISLKSLCPPKSQKIVLRRPCKLKVKGAYKRINKKNENSKYNIMKWIPVGKRVYFSIISKRKTLPKYIRICYFDSNKNKYTSEKTHRKSCSLPGAHVHVLYDRWNSFYGKDWKTVIHSEFEKIQRQNETYYRQWFSFKALLFEDYGRKYPYVVEVFSDCDKFFKCGDNSMMLLDSEPQQSDLVQNKLNPATKNNNLKSLTFVRGKNTKSTSENENENEEEEYSNISNENENYNNYYYNHHKKINSNFSSKKKIKSTNTNNEKGGKMGDSNNIKSLNLYNQDYDHDYKDYKHAVLNTYYNHEDSDVNCESGNMCSSLIINVMCPSGYHFEEKSCSKSKNHHHHFKPHYINKDDDFEEDESADKNHYWSGEEEEGSDICYHKIPGRCVPYVEHPDSGIDYICLIVVWFLLICFAVVICVLFCCICFGGGYDIPGDNCEDKKECFEPKKQKKISYIENDDGSNYKAESPDSYNPLILTKNTCKRREKKNIHLMGEY